MDKSEFIVFLTYGVAEFEETMTEFYKGIRAATKAVCDSSSDIEFPNLSSMEIQPEPEINPAGFTLVNGNTWLPKPLHDARRKQQRRDARKDESLVVWTR